jgi:hypothetical protein
MNRTNDEMIGLDLMRQDEGFEDTRGVRYGKEMAQRAAAPPTTKKYPVIGTDQTITLTREQIEELEEYGELFDRRGNRLVLDNNRLRLIGLRLEKGRPPQASDIVTDILRDLAAEGIDTTEAGGGIHRGK